MQLKFICRQNKFDSGECLAQAIYVYAMGKETSKCHNFVCDENSLSRSVLYYRCFFFVRVASTNAKQIDCQIKANVNCLQHT